MKFILRRLMPFPYNSNGMETVKENKVVSIATKMFGIFA